MKRAVLFGWCAALALAAEPDPAVVLLRASIKARVRADAMANYTCVQTVTRDYYQPRTTGRGRSCQAAMENLQHPVADQELRLVLTDRLRLDVTLTSHGEIYSWAGASKFEDAGVDAVVHQGPISTGSFGALLTVVLSQDLKTFQYRGTTSREGRDLMEYTFQTPQDVSHYKVRGGDSWVYTAYSGTVTIDPANNEAVSLTVRTARLPEVTGSCQTESDMEFVMMKIGSSELPLPKAGRQLFIDLDGHEVENTTTFAACHEYRGESTITFFAEPEAEGGKQTKGVPAQVTKIPVGLHFTFELTTPISSETAAGGDAFSGRLVSALRDKGKVVAPAHALVEGRLLRVEERRVAPVAANLVLRFRTVEVGGVKVPLAAVRDFKLTQSTGRRSTPVQLPYSWEENSGVFLITGQHPAMKAGTRSDWVTR